MKVLLAVTGGIAAYKAVELVSILRKRKDEIKVLMTESATKFISPLTFSAVGNTEVYTNEFDYTGLISHTGLSAWAEIMVIAPATANTIAKIANGIADNIVTASALAFNGPKIVVPAMNVRMYENPVTQDNIQKLLNYGWTIVDPESGHLADGEEGKGRYPDNAKIVFEIESLLTRKDMGGLRVLVTAGPTREAIDPVRYISNRSSGKMGYEIAKMAALRGAQVDLVSGPVNIPAPFKVKRYEVESVQEMAEKVLGLLENEDVVIMAAAVSDYKVERVSDQKIKKVNEELNLKLIKTTDILLEISKRRRSNQFVVGFAAETQNLVENAKHKFESKSLDMIVANDVSRKDIGFESDYDEVFIISKTSDPVHVERMTKMEIANLLLDMVVTQKGEKI
ncbi:bifunctional phosphopantothenoylcysteine decarboxylase/phosphopantothenate--cysteine ligase CoaBC [Athalassotoga sp.]|uniref:bifunctional phosphopantothenoylcysteine decarboxylase/phosphopantothenate--cysteine ligase CoaBC n=1 Tax=Athalassotoga sp. TaxID=2022597 RepID=UPI003D021083